MTDKLASTTWIQKPDKASRQNSENRNIVEIVKAIARRAAETDYQSQLIKLRELRKTKGKTHE